MDATMGQAARGNYNEDVSIQEAVNRFFKNYINFEGRSNRGEYWKAILAYIIAYIVGMAIDAVIGFPILSTIVSLGCLGPGISVAVRRLHDINKSGWWYLLVFVPLIGFIVLIVWFAKKPDPAPNRFG